MLEKQNFNWHTEDKYIELLIFKLQMTNILETRAYEITDEEKVSVIKNWLGWEGLLFIEMFMQEEKEKPKTRKALFSVLSNKFMPCHNHKIISLQY